MPISRGHNFFVNQIALSYRCVHAHHHVDLQRLRTSKPILCTMFDVRETPQTEETFYFSSNPPSTQRRDPSIAAQARAIVTATSIEWEYAIIRPLSSQTENGEHTVYRTCLRTTISSNFENNIEPMYHAAAAIVNFPQSDSCPQNEARVSFGDEIDVIFVENLSYKYKDDLWFSHHDFDAFKLQAARTIRAITSAMTMAQYAELNINDTSAFLGLESYLSKDATRGIKYRKGAIVAVVLSEQVRQQKSGIHDPDEMARVSQAVSELSSRRARTIGLMHADVDKRR